MARIVSQQDCHSTLSAASALPPQQTGVFSVSPNPSAGLLRLHHRLEPGGAGAFFRLTDLSGRCLLSIQLDPALGETNLRLDKLPPGLYYYRCRQAGFPIGCGKILLTR